MVVKNVGKGPALNVRFELRQTNATTEGAPWNPKRFVDYLQAGEERPIQVVRTSLATRNCLFEAMYESLSGKTHETKITIEDNGVIKSFTFK